MATVRPRRGDKGAGREGDVRRRGTTGPTAAPAGGGLRRGLTVAAAPLLLLVLLVGGLRYLESAAAARERAEHERMAGRLTQRGGGAKRRPPLTPPPPLRPLDATTQKQIERIADGQVKAIARGDYAAALSYSTQEFRAWSSPERFREMIQGGYRPLADARRAVFRPGRGDADTAMLPAVITDADGGKTALEYALQRDAEGWHIVGCMIRGPVPSSSVMRRAGASVLRERVTESVTTETTRRL